jgi:hypothetical protein
VTCEAEMQLHGATVTTFVSVLEEAHKAVCSAVSSVLLPPRWSSAFSFHICADLDFCCFFYVKLHGWIAFAIG